MLRNEALVAVDPFPPVDGGLMLPRAIDTHVHMALAESNPEPLYAKCAEFGLPAVFQTVHTGVGAGATGGGGVRLCHCRPIFLDDIAAEFPNLTIVMAHPAWPWHEEQLSVLMHKPNVYMDLSGWSPKYFPPSIVQYANSLIQDKVLFGSDYPVISPERWLRDFEAAGFRDEVRPKILLENAQRM